MSRKVLVVVLLAILLLASVATWVQATASDEGYVRLKSVPQGVMFDGGSFEVAGPGFQPLDGDCESDCHI